MPDETPIVITRTAGSAAATFPTVGITQSQLVFWLNQDSSKAAHWPVFPNGLQPRTQVGFGDTSDKLQPSTGDANFPAQLNQGQVYTVSYGCKISGHSSEHGQVQVVLDFFSNPNQLTDAVLNTPYPVTHLTQGGMPPFVFNLFDVTLPKGMAITNDPVSGATISGTPTEAGDSFAFSMHCEDSFKNAVDQTYLLRVTQPVPVT
ncbi:MAG: hypothetical protein ACRD8O_08655 [Bryobacteraceae bacterium]